MTEVNNISSNLGRTMKFKFSKINAKCYNHYFNTLFCTDIVNLQSSGFFLKKK